MSSEGVRWVRHKSGKLIAVETDPVFDGKPKPKKKRRLWVKLTEVQAERLAGASSVTTIIVFHYLLFLSFRARTRSVRLTNIAMAKLNIDRQRKRRALFELERLGLIGVKKFNRCSPQIVILDLPEDGGGHSSTN